VITVEHEAHSTAPQAAVWSLLADLETWHSWGPWTETRLDGDIRTMVSERKRMGGKPYVMKERVIALVEPERFEYELLSGLPVKDYRSVVTLSTADDGCTLIHWRSTFKPPYPLMGWIWGPAMHKVIRDISQKLADAAKA
jgi:hypothetical protein